MFIRENSDGYYFLAKKVNHKAKYLEKIGPDPDTWLQSEIIKAVTTMNTERVDELRRIQKKRNPTLLPTPDNCHIENLALEQTTIDNFPFGPPDIIITDPPYSKDFINVYDILADKAVELLKEGGSLITMIGQSYLPEIMIKLCSRLSYQWTVAYLTPGGQSAQLWTKRVNTFWKPVLWFVKGEYKGHWIGDVAKSAVNDNSKHHHKWGQSESGMADLIKRFSKRGDIIFDPFMGAGTTGKVALDLGRRFVGIDKDVESYQNAKERLGSQ